MEINIFLFKRFEDTFNKNPLIKTIESNFDVSNILIKMNLNKNDYLE